MATYTLDLSEGLRPEPAVASDGSALYEVVEGWPLGASRAGVAVAPSATEPDDTPLSLTDLALAALDGDSLLLDSEPCELADVPAMRTLVLVSLGGLAGVVLEQWRLVAGGERWLLTATADLAAWAALAPRPRATVATLRISA